MRKRIDSKGDKCCSVKGKVISRTEQEPNFHTRKYAAFNPEQIPSNSNDKNYFLNKMIVIRVGTLNHVLYFVILN